MTLHATLIQINGCGVLLLGPSGCGKSDLAARCMVHGGADLVADDRVMLAIEDGHLVGRAPAPLAGLIEVRGWGILPVPFLANSRIDVVAHLAPGLQAERMPDPQWWDWGGIRVRAVTLDPFQAGSVAKLALLACGLAQNRLPVHWDTVT
jgi:serine kinase of HPr protein (carbohydrate metabolism regulator)